MVATLGPATDPVPVLEAMVASGVDVVRINCAHGTAAHWAEQVACVRRVDPAGEVAVLMDLQGSKVRLACFKEGQVQVHAGDPLTLDPTWDPHAGDPTRVGVDDPRLHQDVQAGDRLLLDDGKVVLRVDAVDPPAVITTVLEGGMLSDHHGINRRGGLAWDAWTAKDEADLKQVACDADFVALSFVRDAQDVAQLRRRLQALGSEAGVVSKIERVEALAHLDPIIQASDAVMVARGDLGVAVGDPELPAIQKKIIQRARALNTMVITATQMMDSMIDHARPTRAEVFDVANAVLDGTDALMLSAETARGQYPVKVVQKMGAIAQEAEATPVPYPENRRMDVWCDRPDEAVAMAALHVAHHMHLAAVVALTESGSTPLWMSRGCMGLPVFALCRHGSVRRRMRLCRGVHPVAFDVLSHDATQLEHQAILCLQAKGYLKQGDMVAVTKGDRVGVHGCTNTLKFMQVGSNLCA